MLPLVVMPELALSISNPYELLFLAVEFVIAITPLELVSIIPAPLLFSTIELLNVKDPAPVL